MADLKGVHTKIDRAKTHLDDFDSQARPIIAACGNAVIREYDKKRSEYIFRFGRVPVVPPGLSAIIGDAVHNLRASLDHLAWQLVIASGRKPTGDTGFPIYRTAPGHGRTHLPQIKPGVPVQVRRILDEIQPYKRPKPAHHELAILSELDNSDKHRELLIAIIGLSSLGYFGDAEPTRFNPGPYDDGAEICRFAYSGTNGENEFNPSFAFTVRLNEPAAGPWGLMRGATDFARRLPLRYIEDEVLPRFRGFF